MKILYLAARFPWPPDRGDRLTGYRFIETMARRHEVTLASFVDGSEPADSRAALEPFCRRIRTVPLARGHSWVQAWLGIASPTPSQVSYYRSAAMTEQVARLAREEAFDVIFVQLFRMAPHVRAIEHPLKVLFLADSLGLALRRSLRFQPAWKVPGIHWEASRVDRYEVAVTREFRESWVLSPEEAERLTGRGARNVRAIRHGVDESLFALPAPRELPRVAVFLGNLSVPHNRDAARFAAREVWPLVLARAPQVKLRLVGADASPETRALGGLPGVEMAGFVPRLADVWCGAGVLLAPLRYSTGIQNKVLEAMAAGVPVVATPPVASAIAVREGEHLLTGGNAAELADAVLATWADPAAAHRRARAAREHVRAHFTWEESVRVLERLAGAP